MEQALEYSLRGFNEAAIFQSRNVISLPRATIMPLSFNEAAIFQSRNGYRMHARWHAGIRFNEAAIFQSRNVIPPVDYSKQAGLLQ